MPRVKSLVNEGGRKIGEEYEVTDLQARIICALDLPGGPKAIIVEALQAEDWPDLPTSLKRGKYGRRDLKAID